MSTDPLGSYDRSDDPLPTYSFAPIEPAAEPAPFSGSLADFAIPESGTHAAARHATVDSLDGVPAPRAAYAVDQPNPVIREMVVPGVQPLVEEQVAGDAAPMSDWSMPAEVQETAPSLASLDDLLLRVVEVDASDLHITSGAPPMLRHNGKLRAIEGYSPMRPDDIQQMLFAITTEKQRQRFEEALELDFSYAVPGKARFRVNLYQQRESLGAAFRLIPAAIRPLEELGIPQSVAEFAQLPRGFVLVTGPTGSGKSTTLASLVDLANRTRSDHIMTVEDPIEFLHTHRKCLVNQREVGEDTHSFGEALKHVLRQDPDIILVGEMRDLETISVALTAAETGHLVFATLHTQDAAQTIDRIIDVFPPHQQQQIRVQLAGALQGVVCQTLARTADGNGRIAATEILVATPAVRNLIREGKTHQIYSALQAGTQHGMQTMDQALADLVRAGTITREVGEEKAHHIEDFMRLAGRGGAAGGGSLR